MLKIRHPNLKKYRKAYSLGCFRANRRVCVQVVFFDGLPSGFLGASAQSCEDASDAQYDFKICEGMNIYAKNLQKYNKLFKKSKIMQCAQKNRQNQSKFIKVHKIIQQYPKRIL